MVQNGSTGPLPVQLQVPPGHLVQQVVDENGTVRHFLLSPPMALPVGAHYVSSTSYHLFSVMVVSLSCLLLLKNCFYLNPFKKGKSL